MTVSNIMTQTIRTCGPETSVAVASQRMRNSQCGVLPVIDARGRVKGIVTDRDLYLAVAGTRRNAAHIAVHEAMTRPVKSCSPDDDLGAALDIMRAEGVRRLPIIDSDRCLLGLLSIDDIVQWGVQEGGVTPNDVVKRCGSLPGTGWRRATWNWPICSAFRHRLEESMRLTARSWSAIATTLLVVLAGSVSVRVTPAQTQSILLTVDLPDRPTVGATVFEEKGCARCHSIGGSGGARIGPDLGRVVFFGDVLDLAGEFWNHAPMMRQKMAELKISRPTLTSDEATNLVAFLTAFRYYETQVREAGNPALGSMVFAKKGCAACHEPGPEQRAQGPDLKKFRGRYAPIVFTQAMWNHSPAMTKAMENKGVSPPAFTGREMTDLAAYLQVGLAPGARDPVVFEPGSPKRGQDLFASKGCVTCHAVAGKGGQGGPDLGNRGRAMARSVPEIAGLMWNHSQKMNAEFARRDVARPSFAGQEMADLIAYLYFVNYANVRATPFRGGQVFSKKCSSCHTLGRQNVGPDLLSAPGLDQPIGIVASMWNHATAMEQQAARRLRTWPRLERGETADLTAFLISRRQEKSR